MVRNARLALRLASSVVCSCAVAVLLTSQSVPTPEQTSARPSEAKSKPREIQSRPSSTSSQPKVGDVERHAIRHVEPKALIAVVKSSLELWGLSVADRALRLGADRKVEIQTTDPRLRNEIRRLLLVLDRVPKAAAYVARSGPTKIDTVRPRPKGKRARQVDILPGDIPARTLLTFLADSSGLTVVTESGAGGIDSKVRVVAKIRNADRVVVESLLERNGWQVFEETRGARTILRAVHSSAPASEIPRPRPIIEVRR